MGHCGNEPSAQPYHEVLSLRTEHKLGNKSYYEPHLTFILDKEHGVLGEMKGRGNEKPHPKYHKAIVELLKHPSIKGIVGGGYQPEKNFHFDDLSEEHKKEVLEAKPDLMHDPKNVNIDYVLNALDFYKHDRFLGQVAARPDFDKEHIDKTIKKMKSNTLAALARYNPNLSLEHQRYIIDSNPENKVFLAKNPNLHPQIRKEIIENRDLKALFEIARRSDLDSDDYLKIASNPNEFIRSQIAHRRNLPIEAQEQLMKDLDPETAEGLAPNPDLHPKFQEIIANNPNDYAFSQLAKNPNLVPKLRRKIIESENEDAITMFANRPDLTPEEVLTLIRHPNKSVRYSVAKNKNLSNELQENLIKENDIEILYGLASNKQLNPKHFKTLESINDETMKKLLELNPAYQQYKESSRN